MMNKNMVLGQFNGDTLYEWTYECDGLYRANYARIQIDGQTSVDQEKKKKTLKLEYH